MTAMRDARLQQALNHAPDDEFRPSPGVRISVQQFAHRAVQSAAAPVVLPLWRRAWNGAGRAGAPWQAAFATLMLATLVTVVWWDKPVPDASPESWQMQPSAKVEEQKVDPAPLASTSPETPRAPAAPTAKPATPTPPPTTSAATAPAVTPPPDVPAPSAERRPAPAAPRPPARKAETPPRADPAVGAAAATGEVSGAADGTGTLATDALDTAQERVAQARPESALAESSRARSSPPAPQAMARRADPLSIELNGRALAATPQQAHEIQNLARALAVQAGSDEALQAPVVAVITVRGAPASAGVLQLAPPQVRWAPDRPGASPSTGRPQPAELQALLDALAQLPAR